MTNVHLAWTNLEDKHSRKTMSETTESLTGDRAG
jgi:hypothetical protein